MFERLATRVVAAVRRVRRVERRELTEFRRWIENTSNLVHLSILLFVPLLIALVTALSNVVPGLSFLLFPPLASGTYTLFADPEGRYASPGRFVVGLTAGAVCGWAALEVAALVYGAPGSALRVHPASAALSILLTGVVTWMLGTEEPAAFSTALLVLLTNPPRGTAPRTELFGFAVYSSPGEYVLSVALSASVVALTFVVWRREFYEQRAEFLYETAHGDDHVLVPMRGETDETTALFGARLAAAHEAGKVVLLDVVEGKSADGGAMEAVAEETAERLESIASTVRTRVGVPCEVVVASGDPVTTTTETARNTNCDLVVAPYEEVHGSLSPFVGGIFRGPIDAVAFRSTGDRRRWKRVLVTVSRPGDSAHAMIDFASRLAGRSGSVSLCTCIDREVERRRAESTLADLAETADADVDVETRVSRTEVTRFIAANADAYDLIVLGASRDRSAASRFVSPPTFERLREVDSDVAVVDRGQPG